MIIYYVKKLCEEIYFQDIYTDTQKNRSQKVKQTLADLHLSLWPGHHLQAGADDVSKGLMKANTGPRRFS